MPKKLTHSSDAFLSSAIRRYIWLKSRERSLALQRTGYCCEVCGVKQSRAKGREVKVEVHHERLIGWARIFKVLREELFSCKLEVLCEKHHDERHGKKEREAK